MTVTCTHRISVLRLVHRSAYMHKLKALSEVLDIYRIYISDVF